MQELKNKELCMQCGKLMRSRTREGYPVFYCAVEYEGLSLNDALTYGKWYKLSTVLYTEAPKKCPYYTEHLVGMLSDTVEENAKDFHSRLGYGRRN